jgi:hypothetical protein
MFWTKPSSKAAMIPKRKEEDMEEESVKILFGSVALFSSKVVKVVEIRSDKGIFSNQGLFTEATM